MKTGEAKVTIPREVAVAIEGFRKQGRDNMYILGLVIDDMESALFRYAEEEGKFDALMRALLDGYECELTDEERIHSFIREQYVKYDRGNGHYPSHLEDYAYSRGIMFALNTLGVTIPGINDAEGGAA